jgi:outer membrane protein TolC
MKLSLVLIICLLVTSASSAEEQESDTDPNQLQLPQITSGEPITLENALQLADQRNLSLNAARADLEKAGAELYAAWSLLLPNASGYLTFTHNDHADVVDIGGMSVEVRKQQDIRSGLSVNMPLINAILWKGIGLSDSGLEASQLQTEAVRQAIFLAVAQAFYQALTTKALIEVHINQFKSIKRHLAVASIRHRSGTGQRLDVVRAQTELLSTYEELLNAHTAHNNSRDALATLIGIEGLPLPTKTPDLAPPPALEEDLQELAERQREDVKLSKKLVELSEDQIDLSWMRFIPSLNASWQLTQQISDLGSFSSPDKTRWFIGLTLSVPLYDHTTYAELDQKRAALHKAQLEADDTRDQARLEVRKNKRDYLKTVEQVSTAQKKASLAKQSMQLAETAYESGTGSSLEVTDTQRVWRAAEIALATKRFEAQLSLLQLLRSIGQDISEASSRRD